MDFSEKHSGGEKEKEEIDCCEKGKAALSRCVVHISFTAGMSGLSYLKKDLKDSFHIYALNSNITSVCDVKSSFWKYRRHYPVNSIHNPGYLKRTE